MADSSEGEMPSTPTYAGTIQYVFKGDAVPPGGVLLSPLDVERIVTKKMDQWEPQQQVLILRYGCHYLGALACLNGYYYSTIFRQAMYLGSYGRVASMLPSMFVPGILSVFNQLFFVTSKIQSGEITCPVCLETRSIALQMSFGFVLPLGLSVLSSSALARNVHSFALPPLTDFRALLKVYAKLLRPTKFVSLCLMAGNIFVPAMITHRQQLVANKIHAKIIEDSSFVT